MREILFRGKGNPKYNSGEWFYGYLCIDLDGDYQICDAGWSRTVLKETIGQYTGLKDANGNKIFEGDIVEEGCNGLISVVVWCEELGTYRLKDLGEDYIIKNAPIEWDVIGNIYDNPELLTL